ncbi:hypothetical protein DFJ75_3916 [Williamsia muralis]|uniref:Uncharacterized protein n=2 Tax=Williamsia marianensis TaxID=85044 RepID=A0A495K9L7_WILMA|nr:hypothetical protein DFJ75_3916 [Williamsia muralis]
MASVRGPTLIVMTYGPPAMTYPHPTPIPAIPPRSPGLVADIIATLCLLALQVLVLVGSVYMSLFFVMATDSCYADRCDTDNLLWAYVVADGGGVAAVVVSTIAATILMVRRRVAFWVPVVGLILQIFTFALGAGLASSVVPS